MKLPFFALTLLAGKVTADQGCILALGIYAHPLDLIRVLTAESFRLELKLTQHLLKIGMPMQGFVFLHSSMFNQDMILKLFNKIRIVLQKIS